MIDQQSSIINTQWEPHITCNFKYINLGIIDLQCCSYYNLLVGFLSSFKLFTKILNYIIQGITKVFQLNQNE